MPKLLDNLVLDRCPHCSVANPTLLMLHNFDTDDHAQARPRRWGVYVCGGCGGVVTAWATALEQVVREWFPFAKSINEDIPERPRTYLKQALESLHAPSGAVMLASSCVDAMLRAKGYRDGSLYARIEKAANDHLITSEMSKWAHDVRLDANDPRHADEQLALPSSDDAVRVIDFASALAELLFVLPGRINRGIQQTT